MCATLTVAGPEAHTPPPGPRPGARRSTPWEMSSPTVRQRLVAEGRGHFRCWDIRCMRPLGTGPLRSSSSSCSLQPTTQGWRLRKKTHASSPSTSGKTHEKTCPIQTRRETRESVLRLDLGPWTQVFSLRVLPPIDLWMVDGWCCR